MKEESGFVTLLTIRILTRFCFLTTLLLTAFLWLSLSLNAQQIKDNRMEKYVGSCHLEVVDELKGIRFPLFLMYPTHVPSKTMGIGPFTIKASTNACTNINKMIDF